MTIRPNVVPNWHRQVIIARLGGYLDGYLNNEEVFLRLTVPEKAINYDTGEYSRNFDWCPIYHVSM